MGCCADENNAEENGEVEKGTKREFDPNFKGPMDDRSCTDIICCLLFLICIIGQCVIGFLAFSYGNPNTLLKPSDSKNRLCGVGDLESRKYLMFFDILQCSKAGPLVLVMGCPTPQVCVEKCPNETWAWLQLAAEEAITGVNVEKRKKVLRCVDSVNLNNKSLELTDLVTKSLCASYTINSTALFDRCIPEFIMKGVNAASKMVDSAGKEIQTAQNETISFGNMTEGRKALAILLQAVGIGSNMVKDVIETWWMIIIGICIGALLSFIWCILMRFVSCFIIYFSMLLFFFGFLGSGGYCFYRYHYVATESVALKDLKFKTDMQYYLAIKETWLVIGSIAGVLALIVLLIIICLRKRIAIAVAVIGQASKAVASIMTTLIFPIFPFVFELAVIGFWAIVAIFLLAVQKVNGFANANSSMVSNISVCTDLIKDGNPEAIRCGFVNYAGANWTFYCQAYNIFMGFWLLCFVVGFGQIVLAGTFASWYWAWEKPRDIPTFPIISAVWRTIRYHLGSVAFGSLIIAIVMMIRAILAYIQTKLKGSENAVAKFFICMLQCCFWCLEKCLRFLTKNAYIIIAIYGKSFCPAAKDAFFLILRNCVRLVVLDKVTDFVLFIGKLLMCGAVGTMSFFFFDGSLPYMKQFRPETTYFFVPIIIIVIGTYIVATLFFSVYSFAVDTLFVCVMEDLERNDGSPEKPYFMSKDLMNILDAKNHFKDDPDSREGCCCGCF